MMTERNEENILQGIEEPLGAEASHLDCPNWVGESVEQPLARELQFNTMEETRRPRDPNNPLVLGQKVGME